MKLMTPRQHDCYAVVASLTLALSRCPTYQEIADQMGIKKVSAWMMVNELIKRGVAYRNRPANFACNIALVPLKPRHSLVFPVLGTIRLTA